MKVAVVDVGSNTVRMLVAGGARDGLEPLLERKARIGLGADVERRGKISRGKLEATADHVRACTRVARDAGCSVLEVVVASPGRQAGNAEVLVRKLARAARAPVRVLSAEEEGRYAFDGALGSDPSLALREPVGICDVGGGSLQVAVGQRGHPPAWVRSFDLGSLRLTTRMLPDDPPSRAQLAAARAEAAGALEGFAPPLPATALAVGGSARALRRLVGPTLGHDDLRTALRLLRKRRSRAIAAEFGIDAGRARTLAAGAAIFAELQLRLGLPLQVVPGGLREGVVLALLDEAAFARAAGGS
jgi:exopolyphosphatase/guanosine-5'-triphosphate,3'-diphosphate pyrophosphatase